jgi:3-phenylpropionate/cinnamic acid dioxygenase small subunit
VLSTQDLIDRAEITDVLHRYAHSVDRRDYEGLRSCYHDDGSDDHGAYRGDADGLVRWIAERHESIEESMHFLGNVLIALDGATAHVESYCVTYQRLRRDITTMPAGFEWATGADTADGSVTYSTGVRYVDDFERRAGTWRIRDRVVVFEWKRAVLHDETSLLDPAWALARRDRDDPFYGTRTTR